MEERHNLVNSEDFGSANKAEFSGSIIARDVLGPWRINVMATSDAIGAVAAAVRHVRCPKCHSVLQEPAGFPVYQCGGCGASLRASPRAASSPPAPEPPSDVRTADAASPDSVLPAPPQRSQSKGEAGDVASTSAAAALDAPTENAGDVAPEVKPPVVEEKGHDRRRSADREAGASSESRRGTGGDAVRAERGADASFSGGSRDAAADSETRREEEADVAARKKGSGETAPAPSRPRSRNLEEAPSMSAPAAEDSRPALKSRREDDAAAAAEEKAPSPPRHALSPLHEKILKTVDELKGDLTELFSQPPEAVVKPRMPPRPPRQHLLPRQQQERRHVPRPAAIPTTRARPAAAAAPRGLPSRRYRRCRADPCGHNARPAGSPCHAHHSCCCRDRHCCGSHRPREEKAAAMAEAAATKRRAAPPTRLQQHCRPVLKGAPFIVCSSCFALVQVPAGFAVSTHMVRELRCGACSAVLSYSYRDRDREAKKNPPHPPQENGHGARRPDLFAFIDDFAAPSSYSTTEDDEPQPEQPLHVSRNSSFEFEAEKPQKQRNSLHRLMGYGSARELLLLPRSPSLYEHRSVDDEEAKRTPTRGTSRRHEHGGDRKGKGVCLDADTDDGEDDSDDAGALRRRSWLHGRGGRGVPPPPGAIRIRS